MRSPERTCARRSASTTTSHAQAHAEPRRLPFGSRRRARSRRADRRAADRAADREDRGAERGEASGAASRAPDGCGRFAGRVIRNVNAKAPTPHWMKQRLERAGQRSISALVDITNYVMLELGRPLHVFDLDKLRGPIDVRWGRPGREGAAAERAGTSRSTPSVCASPTSRASSASAASWAARPPRPTRERATSTSRRRSSVPRRSRVARAATTSRPTPRTASSAASISHNNVDGIECATRLILDICGGEPGPGRRPDRAPARAQARDDARCARAEGHRRADSGAGDGRRASRAWAFDTSRRGDALRRAAAELPLRHLDRGRPDRGSRAHPRLRAHPGASAARSPACMLHAPEGRRSAARICASASPRRDYREVDQLHASSSRQWEADFAGEREPDPPAQPDREPAVGDAQHA